jgi:hypothetical protein
MYSELICDKCRRKDTPLEPIYITSPPENLEEEMDREEEGQLYLCVSCHADAYLRTDFNWDVGRIEGDCNWKR